MTDSCPLPPFSSLKRKRSKPRPNRVKGKDMEALRLACFTRDGYVCQGELGFDLNFGWEIRRVWVKCGRMVTWESGHMAHIRAKRRNGDSLDNVRTLCSECHGLEHVYGPSGVKPCKSKKEANQ